MMSENRLKEQMNIAIGKAVDKYNSAVFILNGGSVNKAVELYNFKCPSKTLRTMCRNANPVLYKELQECKENIPTWCDAEYIKDYKVYYNEPTLSQLRANKHLFIGDSE
jgi:hypothetical protein